MRTRPCDWNPPHDRPPLLPSFPWQWLGHVKSFVVPPHIHQMYAKDCERPILDYVARNACIARSSAPYVLVLNQDIFVTPEIIDFLAKKQLQEKYFYRADRVDFDFAKIKHLPIGDFLAAAKQNVLKRHLHPWPSASSEDMSPVVNALTFDSTFSKHFVRDLLDDQTQIIFEEKYSALLRKLRSRYFITKFFRRKINFYRQFELHTNASGDFVIAAKKAFEKIYGFPETIDFYMHTDSYAILQLFAAGFTQAIFPNFYVYHADHARGDRMIEEKWSFNDHEVCYSDMLYGNRSYQFNDKNWGLRHIDLKIDTLIQE